MSAAVEDQRGDLWRADYGEVWRTLGVNGPDLVMESVDAERIGGCKVTLISRALIRQSGRRMSPREAAIYENPLGFDVAAFLLPWLLGGSS